MKRLAQLIEDLAKVAYRFAGWLVTLMMLLVFTEVFMRYVVQQPLMVGEEFSAYMLVALSFLGAAYTWKERGHVRITALVSRLPARVASWVRLMTKILVLGFVIMLCEATYGFMNLSFKLRMSSATFFHTPLQGPQMTVAIGFVLLLLVLVVDIVRDIQRLRSGKNIEEALG